MAKIRWGSNVPSSDPLEQTIDFGKYKGTGRTWKWVVQNDESYARWFLSGECDQPRSEILEDALTEALEAIEMFPEWQKEQRRKEGMDYDE